MKLTVRAFFLASCLSLTLSAFAFAGECRITTVRTACPGKEEESYKKCGGKQSCDEVKKTGTAAACAKAALASCANVGDRQQTTKSKVLTATFNGKPLEEGKNFCDADRPDFNKCK